MNSSDLEVGVCVFDSFYDAPQCGLTFKENFKLTDVIFIWSTGKYYYYTLLI